MEISMQEFVLKYQSFSEYWARHYSNHKWVQDSGLEYDDLYQQSNLILCNGYYKYNKEKGSTSTYASFIIKFGLLKYINENNHLTKSAPEIKNCSLKLHNELVSFYQRFGRQMTKTEMIQYVKNKCNNGNYIVNIQYVDTLLNIGNYHLQCQRLPMEEAVMFSNNVSMIEDEVYGFDTFADSIKNDYNLEEEAIDSVFVDEVFEYIESKFSDLDYEIIWETFGFTDGIKKTQQEIAEKYDVSRQSINQRYKKVMAKVMKKFSN